MKLSSPLPVHLILNILSSLDDDGLGRAEPAAPMVFPERTSTYVPLSSYELTSIPTSSNWTRRVIEGEQTEDVICHPAGACEPCPEELLQEPYCQPFGNRRLLHCRPASSRPDADRLPPDSRPNEGLENNADGTDKTPTAPPPHHPASRPPQSALPAWESCGRRVPKERADFFEFVLCNVIFAAIALTCLLIRSERMRAVRARRLAARIGVGLRRASSGSWAAMGGMGAALVDAETRSEEVQLMRDDVDGS